jgi:uncharacterized protein (TIGR02453 family)
MSSFDFKYVLDFLSDLALNNERTWFGEHKTTFEKARLTFEKFVDELIRRLSAFEDLSGLTAKDCVMRIYRDMRFSKDKTPYKTCMAALIAAGGKRSGRFGYGLHLGPSETMAGGGLWDPRPEQLAKLRRAVGRDPGAISMLIEAPEFVRTFGGLRGEKLKAVPKGYDKDHPAVEILKLKQVYVARSFSDRAVCAHDFADRLIDTYQVMKPFLGYLTGAVF